MIVWASRFYKKIDPEMETFNASIPFDKHFLKYDIAVSIAHIEHLFKIKVITANEKKKFLKAFQEIKKIKLPTKIDSSQEDIHSFIENWLKKKIGDLTGKLHTGRSRNDLVATDFRLFINQETIEIKKKLFELLEVLTKMAQKNINTILPGFTHLQSAQPITFAFYLLSFFFMFLRDYQRLEDNQKRINLCPLGSGALAGINYPHSRVALAKRLGFQNILPNAMDAVSARDFLVEFHSNLSISMMHLSRLAEDLILYSNQLFDFVKIDDKYATGSSIMPNKKNADSLELIRGKTGRVYGHLMGLLTVLKAIPMAYNKDLQEDKEGTFDSIYTIKNCLSIMTKVISSLKINPKKMLLATEKGYLPATDVADYLVKKNVPFRQAHQIVGNIVKYLEKKGKVFSDLELEEFKSFSAYFNQDIFLRINLENIIQAKKSVGSTSMGEVKKQISLAKKHLKKIKQSKNKDVKWG